MLPRSQLARAFRSFSSTACNHAHVSNIGKKPITFPETVRLMRLKNSVTVIGPLGTATVPLEHYMHLVFDNPNTFTLNIEDTEVKKQREMWGLTRTLINNAIVGMTEGFNVPLYLVGVGYRAALEEDPRGTEDGGSGQRLNMKLGYSHSVLVPIPPHIKAEVPIPTKIILSCTDKEKLGLFAARVRKWRKPEPYKGKGIFIGKEQIRIKNVKKK
ncbi:hypothetical protein JAAARDRAFT_170827 [Jaapia argillacea MUCL 33604]|uniref:Large ribosomal subunit protein uL6 alpha-beta domain-containing protein n=1 Tax=Jaapia argillacea MUCL 33604 TaxID=933084 RepID=A0A067QIN0_9AGAM|nr:hypothetical protein JAAARDRAFT_170827 [Jaapia argillacea MUCL 33604]